MFDHVSRLQLAVSFAAIVMLGTAFGAGAESLVTPSGATAEHTVMTAAGAVVNDKTSDPIVTTAAATSNAPAQASEASLDMSESMPAIMRNHPAIEITSPSRFNKTIDYGE
jgi:hypothetical protein